jgi:hypothetical protein
VKVTTDLVVTIVVVSTGSSVVTVDGQGGMTHHCFVPQTSKAKSEIDTETIFISANRKF